MTTASKEEARERLLFANPSREEDVAVTQGWDSQLFQMCARGMENFTSTNNKKKKKPVFF